MSYIRKILDWMLSAFKPNECDCSLYSINRDTKESKCLCQNVSYDEVMKTYRSDMRRGYTEADLRLRAYLIAEKDGFRQDPAVYWEEAQRG